jgi:CRP-like cAMP-binding protein
MKTSHLHSASLCEVLKTFAGFTDEEYEWYSRFLEVRFLKKKEHLLRVGEVIRFTAYVERGCLRRYTVDEQGKETIVGFATEDNWTGDLESFLHQCPTTFFIQALEECELQMLSYESFHRVCEHLPKYKVFHDAKIERNHYATIKRLVAAMSATPEEKYLQLEHNQPQLFQRVPLHYIASYLGIEPESLSRLRRRVLERPQKS